MKRRRTLIFLGCVVYLWLFGTMDVLAVSKEKREQEPSLVAKAAVLMDGKNGRILYGKNQELVLPMASTTKIMTCILALEQASLQDVVQVSARAASMPDVQLHIKSGETYYLGDLLYSLMLESHNDTAVAIAEHIGGSVEAFADRMNQKAKELGCTNTWFVTPNGLDGVDEQTQRIHGTTAEELAKILQYCIAKSPKKEMFLEITRAPSHSFSNLEHTRSFSCINHNALLTSMDGTISGKTGFTNQAGYCYVGAVEREGKILIGALLACGWPPNKNDKWQDMRALIEYGENSYDYYEIEKETFPNLKSKVNQGEKNEVMLSVQYPDKEPIRMLMRNDEPVRIVKKINASLDAPIREQTVAGQIEYYVSNTLISSYPLVTTESVERWSPEFCLKDLLKKYFFCYNSR